MPEMEKIKPAVTATNAPTVTIVHFDEKKKKERKENVTDGK